MQNEIDNEATVQQGLALLKKYVAIYIPDNKTSAQIDKFLHQSVLIKYGDKMFNTVHFVRAIVHSKMYANAALTGRARREEPSSAIIELPAESEGHMIENFVDLRVQAIEVPCKWTQDFVEFSFISRVGHNYKDRLFPVSANDNGSAYAINVYQSPLADRISVVREYKKQFAVSRSFFPPKKTLIFFIRISGRWRGPS